MCVLDDSLLLCAWHFCQNPRQILRFIYNKFIEATRYGEYTSNEATHYGELISNTCD